MGLRYLGVFRSVLRAVSTSVAWDCLNAALDLHNPALVLWEDANLDIHTYLSITHINVRSDLSHFYITLVLSGGRRRSRFWLPNSIFVLMAQSHRVPGNFQFFPATPDFVGRTRSPEFDNDNVHRSLSISSVSLRSLPGSTSKDIRVPHRSETCNPTRNLHRRMITSMGHILG